MSPEDCCAHADHLWGLVMGARVRGKDLALVAVSDLEEAAKLLEWAGGRRDDAGELVGQGDEVQP